MMLSSPEATAIWGMIPQTVCSPSDTLRHPQIPSGINEADNMQPSILPSLSFVQSSSASIYSPHILRVGFRRGHNSPSSILIKGSNKPTGMLNLRDVSLQLLFFLYSKPLLSHTSWCSIETRLVFLVWMWAFLWLNDLLLYFIYRYNKEEKVCLLCEVSAERTGLIIFYVTCSQPQCSLMHRLEFKTITLL